MAIDLVNVLAFFGIDSIWFVAVFVLIVWVLFFTDNVEKVRTIVFQLFGFLGSRVRRRFHRSAIVSALNPQIRLMQRELGIKDDLPPIDVRYAPTRRKERPKFEDGRVIIYLRDAQEHRTENVTRAAMDYVNASIYPLSRPYMNDVTNQALDMALTRRLLVNNKDAFSYFTRHFVDDECNANEDLRKVYESILLVDERGFLASVLLHQLAMMTTRLYPRNQHERAVQVEVVGFVRWIAKIAARETGEQFHPRFEMHYIRVGIILLGRDETLEASGFTPYVRAASGMVMAGHHGFYVLAAGRKAPLVNRFMEVAESNGYLRPRIANISVKHLTVPERPRSDHIAVGYVQLARDMAREGRD